MSLEASRSYKMDNFVKLRYEGMSVTGQHWNQEEGFFEEVTLPVMLIEPLEGKQGVYVVNGQDCWCEHSVMD